ncbi:MAG: PDZ domain-containing protein [Elusimicrobia bacterium]|nr:PDZ domain-containing protein [Elusimicrobiota bacterium]
MKQMTKYCILLSGIFAFYGLTGCINPYHRHYQNMLEKWPESVKLLKETPEADEPKLVTSTDLKQDMLKMLENGYLLIGKATFKSPPIDAERALAQARTVGADVVFVNRQYVTTKTESVAMTEWLPDKTITTTETSTFKKNPDSAPSIYQREVTQTLEGESYTRYVPRSTDYYRHTALFLKKSKPLKFGVLVHSLDDETKKRLETNRGVVVKVVVNDSPAFHADILRDDIITHCAGEPVAGPKDFFEKIKEYSGQTIMVRVIRDWKPKEISLTLR